MCEKLNFGLAVELIDDLLFMRVLVAHGQLRHVAVMHEAQLSGEIDTLALCHGVLDIVAELQQRVLR